VGFLHRKFLGVVETHREAVMRNLVNLLQAKRGAASLLPGFGLTETGFRSDAERLAGLGAEIRETLSRYEPRVEVLEINEAPAPEGGAPGLMVRLVLRDSREPMDLLLDPASRRLRERPQDEEHGEDAT
jgi:predicted component of type VI protein secretion system